MRHYWSQNISIFNPYIFKRNSGSIAEALFRNRKTVLLFTRSKIQKAELDFWFPETEFEFSFVFMLLFLAIATTSWRAIHLVRLHTNSQWYCGLISYLCVSVLRKLIHNAAENATSPCRICCAFVVSLLNLSQINIEKMSN